MKRALIAVALGGVLLVGTPTLALSAQRNDVRAEKGDKGGDKGDKGGDKGKGGDRGDHKGDRGDRADHRDRGDRGDHRHGRHDRDRHGHRHGHHHGGYYDYYYGYPYYGPGYGGSYGDPYYYDRYGAGRDATVLIRGLAFNPPEVNIRPGGHVTWQFYDRAPHTVTADNGSFDSGQRHSGEFRLYFNQPGTYSYHCAIHPDMKGRVLVG